MLADRQCDAIILYTRHMSEKAIMSLINSIAMPLVVINRDVAQAANAACFRTAGSRLRAVEYLITGATVISPASPSRCTPPPARRACRAIATR